MESAGFLLAVTVIPIVVGFLVVALSRRLPSLAERPLITALVLFFLLVVLTSLATPGSDVWAPALGEIVSFAVSGAVFIALRRRKAETATHHSGPVDG